MRYQDRKELEYELIDTGVFDENRYFDVFVEYAKAYPEDILIKITVHNRGPEEAELHLLPTLWSRNDRASWIARPSPKPLVKQIDEPANTSTATAAHAVLGTYSLYSDGQPPLLFTENSTNHATLHLDYPDIGPYLKDGINNYVVGGQQGAINPEHQGTKVAHYQLKVAAGQSATVRLRLTADGSGSSRQLGATIYRLLGRPLTIFPPVSRKRMNFTTR